MNKKSKQEVKRIFSSTRARNISLTLLMTLIILLGGTWLLFNEEGGGTNNNFDTPTHTDQTTLTVEIPETIKAPSLTLFADLQEFTLDTKKEAVSRNLAPGTYRIIIKSPTSYPWTKKISLKARETIVLDPFLLQKEYDQKTYDYPTNPEVYLPLEAGLKKENKKTRATSTDGTVAIDFKMGTLTAHWKGQGNPPFFFCKDTLVEKPCPSKKIIFGGAPILDATFLSSRNNVILFGTPNGIYAIEISAREPQNFQPVYQNPLNALAFKDGSAYFQKKGTQNTITEIRVFNPHATSSAPAGDKATTTGTS